jgi:hypothetical protein
MKDAFHFFRGLYKISKRWIVILLNTNFREISIALVVLAFWHPLDAVLIFILLFIFSLTGSPVSIQRFTFKNVCYGCWNWLRFLMEPPTEQ